MGISGTAVHSVVSKALNLGADQVHYYDDKNPKAKYGPDHLPDPSLRGTLIVSPGVPLATPWIMKYLKTGWTLSGELSIAASFLTTERMIGITGSIGKSTVTSLIGYGLQQEDLNCFAGGNLGRPLAEYILDKINKPDFEPAKFVVLELSSYQLENLENLNLEVGVITYLTPNHMERYASLDAYYSTKWRLLNISEQMILNKNGGDLVDFSSRQKNINQPFWTDRSHDLISKFDLSENKMVGTHNLDNIAIAAKAISLVTTNEACISVLKNFSGLSHRLENCGYHQERLFINDSKSTSIQSVLEAVQSVLPMLNPNSRLCLLVGGRDKNLPWKDAKVLKNHKSLNIIYFGEVGKKAEEQIGITGRYYQSLQLALENLKQDTNPSDIILLSPGGTSHDEFTSFEHRGNYFKEQISRIFK